MGAIKENKKEVNYDDENYSIENEKLIHGKESISLEEIREQYAKIPNWILVELDIDYDKFKNTRMMQDFCLVKPIIIKPKVSTKSGVLLPDGKNSKEQNVYFDEHPMQGLVVAVGPGIIQNNTIIENPIKIGDHVFLNVSGNTVSEMYSKYNTTIIDGEDVIIIRGFSSPIYVQEHTKDEYVIK